MLPPAGTTVPGAFLWLATRRTTAVAAASSAIRDRRQRVAQTFDGLPSRDRALGATALPEIGTAETGLQPAEPPVYYGECPDRLGVMTNETPIPVRHAEAQ